MATLREYYDKDQGGAFGIGNPYFIANANGERIAEIASRLNINFESNSIHISFYIPYTECADCPSRVILDAIEDVLAFRSKLHMAGGRPSEEASTSDEAVFTGRVYLYTENDVSPKDREFIAEWSRNKGYSVKIRDNAYAKERSSWEKPLAFVSHDTRDKETIARPLAMALQTRGCPVWYDEFSLKIGDSLRENIERGVKESKNCILILTPNFLSNGGWTKKEYDSIFTRELVDKQNVILPIWHDVSVKDIYSYSPTLADRLAIKWTEGVDEVARKLSVLINK